MLGIICSIVIIKNVKNEKCIPLIYLLCCFTALYSQTPTLLKDIIPGSVGGFTTAGQFGYYYHPFTIVWEHNNEIFLQPTMLH